MEEADQLRSHPAVPRLRLRPLSERSPLWYHHPSGSMPWGSAGPSQTNPESAHSSQPTPGAPRDPLLSLLQSNGQDAAGQPTPGLTSGSRLAADMHGGMGSGARGEEARAEAGQGQRHCRGQGQGREQASRWEAADKIAEGSANPPAERGGVAWGRGVQGPQPGPPSKGPLPPALDGLLQLHLAQTHSRCFSTLPSITLCFGNDGHPRQQPLG